MKILFLSSYAHLVLDETSTRTSGGAELQVALLARELAKRGHEAIIAGGNTGQTDGAVLQGVRLRNAGNFHTGRMTQMLASLPRVFGILREEKPDWVIVMGWTAWLFVLWLWRPLLGYRLDFTCSLDTEVNGEYRRENPFLGALFEFAMRRCDARHAITEGQMEHYRRAGLEATLYRYLVFPRRAPRTADKDIDFLWVSRCQPVKQPHLFVDLARALPGHSFVMICPPENRALWDDIAAAAQGVPNLRLSESVPYHGIQDWYDRARVFVNTSQWEGWPNSFIQAGLGRTALLSLRVDPDGIFEKFGLGIRAGDDVQRMVEGARRLMNDPALLASAQDGAARFVREAHDNEANTTAFLRGLEPA
jgi:glycosyltransferase involved in cell wall biosynthesis